MKHVLVTGGNGFIGRYVVEELRSRAYQPVVFDRKLPKKDAVSGYGEDWSYFFGDIKDSTLVDDAVSHVDGVIHLAGVLGTQETVADPRPAAETNILGGLNVITACAKYDVPLVNIAVGNYWMNNTYSITKNSIERFVEMKKTYEGKVMTSVRALNAYGPRQSVSQPYGPSRVRKIMPSFICRALSGEPIEVYGDGSQVMDMIYVTDVATALVAALKALDEGIEIQGTLEAGTGRETTVLGIAETVNACLGSQLLKSADIKHLPMRPGEPPNSTVLGDPKTLEQIGMMRKDLTTLEVGVDRTVRYFRDYLAERP